MWSYMCVLCVYVGVCVCVSRYVLGRGNNLFQNLAGAEAYPSH